LRKEHFFFYCDVGTKFLFWLKELHVSKGYILYFTHNHQSSYLLSSYPINLLLNVTKVLYWKIDLPTSIRFHSL